MLQTFRPARLNPVSSGRCTYAPRFPAGALLLTTFPQTHFCPRLSRRRAFAHSFPANALLLTPFRRRAFARAFPQARTSAPGSRTPLPQLFPQKRKHPVIIFRHMRECTARAVLDGMALLIFAKHRIPGAVPVGIQRTIAKQAVKRLPLHPLMARKIAAASVFKKAMARLHRICPPHPVVSARHERSHTQHRPQCQGGRTAILYFITVTAFCEAPSFPSGSPVPVSSPYRRRRGSEFSPQSSAG